MGLGILETKDPASIHPTNRMALETGRRFEGPSGAQLRTVCGEQSS